MSMSTTATIGGQSVSLTAGNAGSDGNWLLTARIGFMFIQSRRKNITINADEIRLSDASIYADDITAAEKKIITDFIMGADIHLEWTGAAL